MEKTQLIYDKLEAFIRKYYTNELLRGSLFFVGLGVLYFLFTLLVEYFLWLSPAGRTALFWAFVVVEVFLLVRYILFPLFKLAKLQKGIGYEEASQIIGSHFGEVSDKLTNFLQLSADPHKSELLMASIDQKAANLQPIPFQKAVNYKSNLRFVPLALIPLALVAFFYISGNSEVISQSFGRVVNYNKKFNPPAPFSFVLLNQGLKTQQGKDFLVRVKTQGRIVPETAMIVIGDERYFMESQTPGEFSFTLTKPVEDVTFHVEANEISSGEYTLEVVEVPSIANFEMTLEFPSYLKRKSEAVKGTGNAIVPEGTRVTWKMLTVATEDVVWTDGGQTVKFRKEDDRFSLTKGISQNTEYQIVTSNDNVKAFEKLQYRLAVIKDQFPTISVATAPDSLKLEKNYVLGRVSDDYGLTKLQIVYYPIGKENQTRKAALPVKNDVYDRFVFAFPSTLPVEKGVNYEYYFEVFDNDAPHGFKSSKSSVFSNRIQTDQEAKDELLQQQNDNINSLQKSLQSQEKQLSEMDKLRKMGKEKESLDFKDQQKVNEFIKRQQQQDELMKEFAKKLDKNLDEFKSDKKEEFKEELQKRLDKVDKDLEKNQKLLDELKQLNDKIQKEELFEKMDRFKQNAKNQAKSLEQLVELTKRFYVEKKAEQLAEKLSELGEKQDKLSEDKDNNAEKQAEINKEFDQIKDELKELEKENKELKSPMDIPNNKEDQKSVEEDLKKATQELQQQNKAGAKPKQKSAAKKMMEMGSSMALSMAADEKEQMEEDVKMLRQILDNLLAYSFSQEDLMKQFKTLRRGAPAYNMSLRRQQDLKQQFKHVDDSLFAMSLRNPKIAEDVTREIGNVHYNVDKSLETLSEGQVPKGASHQQYAVTSANKLADMLSNLLNSMQMSLSGSGAGKPKPGKGEGSGMQLPDIIQKQKGLGEKMKDGMKGDKPGDKQGDKPGEKPGDGQQGKQGQGKKPGQQGQSGQGNGQGDGEQGDDGEGDARAIMEIYREQKQLREALEKELERQGMGGNGQSAIQQMKQLEKQLLNKGFNNENMQRALNLQYELLKLEKAMQQQGEEKKRQAQTNKQEFGNQARPLPPQLQEYLNSIEILNRQALPLRPNYSQKVQEYFKND